MKKITLLLFGTTLLMLLPLNAWSQEAYVWYEGNGSHTLTFCYDDQRSSREGYTYDLNEGKQSPGWLRWANYIIDVVFNPEFADARPTTTHYWFNGFYSINEVPTLTNLNTSQVTDMSSMFRGCSLLFQPDMSKFDTSNVTDMSYMFYGCGNTSKFDVSKFNTSKVTDMSYMFYNCKMLGSFSLSNFDLSNVTDMRYMFGSCTSTFFSVSFSNTVNTSKLIYMDGMFSNCKEMSRVDLSKFDTSNVTSMNSMFSNCSMLRSANLSNFDLSNVTDMNYMFNNCTNLQTITFGSYQTSNLKSLTQMFYNCGQLTSLDLSKFDTSNVTNMSSLFYNCHSLKTLDLSNFDTSNVTNMSNMFNNCYGLTSLNLSNLDTSNVTNMSNMFNNCYGLTTLDVSYLDTSNVTDMNSMFYNCYGLTALDISNFEITEETNSDDLLYNCNLLQTLKISESMGNLSSTAFYAVGSRKKPCTIYPPKNFDFGNGVDTSGDYFLWKAGFFKLYVPEFTISSLGIATFCYDEDLNFSDVTDYKAYVVSGFNSESGNATLVRVNDAPAGTGLLLKGTPGTYKVPVGTSKSLFGNYLIGTTETTNITPTVGNKTNLVLSSKKGKVGFYTFTTAFDLGPNKAYLQLPTSILETDANGLGIEFDDETTGINGVEAEIQPDVVWYTIDGRKLDAKPTQKGLYISNGRKVLIP